MTFGISSAGFSLKRLADILDDMKSALQTVVDPVSGETLTIDLEDENDPLVQQINAFSDGLAECWEQLQLAYNQFDPLKCSGAGMNGTFQLNGLRRRAGVKSQVVVTITGTPGLTLEAGKQITTADDYPIFELPLCQIGIDGTEAVLATCTEYGDIEASAGTLVKILTPISGWTSVTNALDAVPGSEEETDTEFRARQQASTSYTAQTIPEAIAAGISALEGVTFVKVYQNINLTTDSRGIPAKSIAPIIVGGDDEEIAQVLFEKLACGGADCYGSTEETITDNQSIDYTMRFSRPAEVPIYIDVDVTIINSALWPSTGAADLKAAILSFATLGAGSLQITSGYDRDGYSPGQSVYATELYIPCYSIPGIKVNSIVIGTTPSPADPSVDIDWDEIATFSSDNIDVTVT